MKSDPAALCRFFSEKDAVRWALEAYGEAVRGLEPPNGEPFVIDGEPWADACNFADDYLRAVEGRLVLARMRNGVKDSPAADEPLAKPLAIHHPNYPRAWRTLLADETPLITFAQLEAGLPPLVSEMAPSMAPKLNGLHQAGASLQDAGEQGLAVVVESEPAIHSR